MERRGIAQHGAGDVVAGGEEHVTLGERDQVVGLVAQAGVERVRVVEVSSQEGVVGGGDGSS